MGRGQSPATAIKIIGSNLRLIIQLPVIVGGAGHLIWSQYVKVCRECYCSV